MTSSTSREGRVQAFQNLYLSGGWSGTDGETVSGSGSTLEYTQGVRRLLPFVFENYGIASVVDAPCGDFHWFKEIPLPTVEYIGLDIGRHSICPQLRRVSRTSSMDSGPDIYCCGDKSNSQT